MHVETPIPASNARSGYPIDGLIRKLWEYQAMLTRDWDDIGHDPAADSNFNERMAFVERLKFTTADYVAFGANERAYATVIEWIRMHRALIHQYVLIEDEPSSDRFYAFIDTFMRERVYDFLRREG